MSEFCDIQAVCITLNPRNPDRAQRAVSEIQKLGFRNVSFFEGVRGDTLSDDELKNLMTPRAYFELKNGRYVHEALSGVGSVGCYLAHTNAWKKCLFNGEPLAIFEDDFVAKPNSREIIEKAFKEACSRDFDVLRLQHRSNPDYGEILIPLNSDVIVGVLRTEGTCAYIITPRAANILLERAFPLDMQIDHYVDMGCFYHNLKNYATASDLFEDTQIKSLVDHNSIDIYQEKFNNATYRRHYKCIWIMIFILVVFCIFVYTKRS